MTFDYTNKAWIRNHRTSLKRTSYDAVNYEFMTESPVNVISFDSFKEEYLSNRELDVNLANSVDALTANGEYTYLIEFKNGNEIDIRQVENKLKDSVIILCDEWGRTVSDTQKRSSLCSSL